MAAHRFSYLAAEHMDPEDLGIVVALGEGEAVALRRAVVAAHAEQNLVDGVVGDLRVRVGVQEPVCKKKTFKMHKKTFQRETFLSPPAHT